MDIKNFYLEKPFFCYISELKKLTIEPVPVNLEHLDVS